VRTGRLLLIAALFVALMLEGCLGPSQATVHLGIVGEASVEDLFVRTVAPEFARAHPDLKLAVTRFPDTDALRRHLEAQTGGRGEKAIDVALVPAADVYPLVMSGLIGMNADRLENWAYLVRLPAARSLYGREIIGYAVPGMRAQLDIAYRPDLVEKMPADLAELTGWIKQNPRRFGYSNPDGRGGGFGWLIAWIYWKGGDYRQLLEEPFSPAAAAEWQAAVRELKSLPVRTTATDEALLEMLLRGEIAMAPVWTNRFHAWAAGRSGSASIRLQPVSFFLPAETLYFTLPRVAAEPVGAARFLDFVMAPETQAKLLVGKGGFYPGIELGPVERHLPPDAKRLLLDRSGVPPHLPARELPPPVYLEEIRKLYRAAAPRPSIANAAAEIPGTALFAGPGGLQRLQAGTLVPLKPFADAESAVLSPDGRWLAGLRRSGQDATLLLWPVEGGDARTAGTLRAPVRLAWTADSRYLAAFTPGADTLWLFPAAGGTPAPLPVGAPLLAVTATPDRLLLETWRREQPTRLLTARVPEGPVTLLAEAEEASRYAWAPDGSGVAYIRAAQAGREPSELRVAGSDGVQTVLRRSSLVQALPAAARVLLDHQLRLEMAGWSPAGDRIALVWTAVGDRPRAGVLTVGRDGSEPRTWILPAHAEGAFGPSGQQYVPPKHCEATAVAWMAGGGRLLVGLRGPGCDGRLVTLDAGTMLPVTEWTVPRFDGIGVSPDGTWAVAWRRSGHAVFLSPEGAETEVAVEVPLTGWSW
jgi:ABC-type uncharacterized transport system YnjBCD substrate-binding protein